MILDGYISFQNQRRYSDLIYPHIIDRGNRLMILDTDTLGDRTESWRIDGDPGDGIHNDNYRTFLDGSLDENNGILDDYSWTSSEKDIFQIDGILIDNDIGTLFMKAGSIPDIILI